MKIILIPPCDTYGDIFSIIGMIYFLTNYYENIILLLQNNKLISYYNVYFCKCELFNKKIFINSLQQVNLLLQHCKYDEYHICNTLTGDWKGPNYFLYKDNIINKHHYFNTENPIYNFLTIPDKYKCSPNKKLPLQTLEINHMVYYQLLGMNNLVRMDYFKYTRDYIKENLIEEEMKKKFQINTNDKYNIIYNSENNIDIKKLVKNNFKIINIHYLVDFPGWLCKLIENAEHIYLVEGNIVNFIYHCQYKNIIKRNPVYFYTQIRIRNWPHYKLDYASKMMCFPKLDNWEFV